MFEELKELELLEIDGGYGQPTVFEWDYNRRRNDQMRTRDNP